MTDKRFNEILHKVMKHNDYTDDMTTVAACNERDAWTPCDLIMREYLNNGGGSAIGFLGITKRECCEAYDFIMDDIETFIAADMINERAWNNSGFPLWNNYNRSN